MSTNTSYEYYYYMVYDIVRLKTEGGEDYHPTGSRPFREHDKCVARLLLSRDKWRDGRVPESRTIPFSFSDRRDVRVVLLRVRS